MMTIALTLLFKTYFNHSVMNQIGSIVTNEDSSECACAKESFGLYAVHLL